MQINISNKSYHCHVPSKLPPSKDQYRVGVPPSAKVASSGGLILSYLDSIWKT